MALAATLKKRHNAGGVTVGIFTVVASGNYATGGDDLDLTKVLGYTNRLPDFVDVNGISGYTYQYDIANKKLKVFQVAGFTPAGTISAPSFTVKNGTILTNGTMGLTADAASASVVGGTAITTDRTLTTTSPVGVPTFTGSAVAAGAGSELPASSYPSGVTGDTITLMATWLSTPGLASN